MIDNLADVYGIELGYWSRLQLFKSTLVNMAAAGASELAIDASMDLMSMDLAGKLSARAGQGIGVGILTARLGLKQCLCCVQCLACRACGEIVGNSQANCVKSSRADSKIT
ncbi:membrane protein YcjF [Vibrio ponticus]|nr:membrane protein YcjF [Vibrio ponticus]